ncbi:MAG: hypothetical protein COA65_09755 [Rhodospirillaceae bacterium]|nr:MAG: hypothetical protein COA65_09755 [Rhodospirillaceae bacterium]
MKTPEEVQALKDNWLDDPCYDIEQTIGFHHHKQELLYFREEKEAEWAEKESDRIHERAFALNVTVEAMEKIEVLEHNESFFTESAKNKLAHYLAAFKPHGARPFTTDEIGEIKEIVDHIIMAATIVIEREELQKPAKNPGPVKTAQT